jgi:GNAT superfamily N-acetyltransferase
MRALRTQLDDEVAFVSRVDEVQRPQGYRLAAVVEDGRAVAVAGFRVIENLWAGRMLYVDDLSTLPEARGRGHAGALLGWCEDEARRLGCDQLHLDSGVQPERFDAHRLYMSRRLRITSFHFAKPL